MDDNITRKGVVGVAESNGSVSYTVKELLAKLEGKIDSVLVALSNKVDRAEFDLLRKQVDELRETQNAGAAVSRDRRWFVNLAFTALGVAVALAASHPW